MKENRAKKTFVQLFTLAVLMFVTYYLIMRDKDFSQVMEVLESSSKGWLVLALGVMALFVFCGGWAIRVLVKPLGYKLSVWHCFKYSFIENYFSAITPSSTGGQPAQMIYMGHDGFHMADSSVVLIGITVLYKFAFLAITAVLFILNLGFITGPFSSVWPLAILGLVCNLALISFLLIFLFNKKLADSIIKFVIRVLAKLGFVKNREEKLAEYEEKLENYHKCSEFFMSHKGYVIRCFGVLVIQRLALLSITVLVYYSFGLTEFTGFQVLATQCLLNLCVDMMPLPGAVGISETVFLMLFTPVFTEKRIATAVLLSRGISFYLLVIVSALAIVAIHLIEAFKTKKTNVRIDEENKE